MEQQFICICIHFRDRSTCCLRILHQDLFRLRPWWKALEYTGRLKLLWVCQELWSDTIKIVLKLPNNVNIYQCVHPLETLEPWSWMYADYLTYLINGLTRFTHIWMTNERQWMKIFIVLVRYEKADKTKANGIPEIIVGLQAIP